MTMKTTTKYAIKFEKNIIELKKIIIIIHQYKVTEMIFFFTKIPFSIFEEK